MKSWVIYIAAALGFAIYGASTNVDRDENGDIVGGGTVDAFNVQIGDCFNDTFDYDEEVTSVPGVPCSEPHDNETFAVFDLKLESYPADDQIGEIAYESCLERFESFVGNDYESSVLEINMMYPTTESWAANDREVICAIFDMNGEKLVNSARGRGL